MSAVSINTPNGPSAARAAFAEARSLVLQERKGSSIEPWLKDKYTIEDVRDAIDASKYDYETKSNIKRREWLGRLSRGMLAYGKVMDMLAQHHPEYVSLAWGTTKFLFVLFQNYDELITELAKSLSDIADVLPRLDIYVDMYNDSALQSKAKDLFALIIQHFHALLKFYGEGRLKHAWRAFIQPFSLRFKKLRDEIDECSRSIEKRAEALLHTAVNEIRSQDTKLDLILQRLALIKDDTVLLPSVALSQQRLEMSTLIDKTANMHIHSPIDALQLRQAYSKRHIARLTIPLNDVWNSSILKSWSTTSTSKTLLIRGSWPIKNDIDTIGTELTTFAHSGSSPVLMVLWALQHKSSEGKKKITWTEVLRCLAGQALKQNTTAVSASFSNNFNLLNVATASSTEDWETVLVKSLVGVPLVYIVIDLEIIEDDLLERENVDDITESIRRLIAASSATLKFAIINQRRQRSFNLADSLSLDVDALKRRGRATPRATRVSNRRAAAGRSRVPLVFRANNRPGSKP